ncbi:MAG TPA: ATP-binding protein [Amycolatopsis sp.]|uniref:ATP-binding protein n=1 Tax=Amycolatopsis sp. TaxID=37632 RepID=UPI002B490897|nr:ATP-binding protein [Amycolatopsis sp.]HKS44065.1 ATP-binding protein [Amycolatopsis sp.]
MPPTSEQQDEHPAHSAQAPDDGPATTLHLLLPVEWVSPSIARDRVRHWLRAHECSPAHVDELVLAVSEAVSNSIEHGYGVAPESAEQLTDPPGVIEFDAEVVTGDDGRRVEFTIADKGRWLDPSPVKGCRGHGLTIIRACADEVRIDGGAGGTVLFLRSRPIPPPL